MADLDNPAEFEDLRRADPAHAQPAIPRYYTNAAMVRVTPYDVVLALRLNGPDVADPEAVAVTPLCDVYMSPQHAKLLTFILMAHIRDYEKAMGEIPMPPEFKLKPKSEKDAAESKS